MKKLKRWLATLIIGVSLCLSFSAYATFPVLPKDFAHNIIQVFAPINVITVDNGSLDVSGYKVIMFNTDVTIQINGSGSTYSWPADTPLGIGVGVTSLTISDLGTGTTALVM